MKKVIGLIIALVFIMAIVGGIAYMVSNDSLNSNKSDAQASRENEQEENTTNNDINNTIADLEQEQNDIIQNNTNEVNSGEEEKTSNNGKILIAFFSRADENYNVGTVEVGNTEIMAGFMKDYLGNNADTFKIDPVNAYPADYRECTEVATQEKNSNARPEFKGNIDISDYDIIFIGYPIWWGDVPMIINTFLEKYDFSGKTVIPFCTHEGSGNAGTFTSIRSKMSSSTVNTNGLAIRGKDARKESSRSTVENWLKGLGF